MAHVLSTLQECPISEEPSLQSRGCYDNQMNYVSDWSSSSAAQTVTTRSVRDFPLSTVMESLTLAPRDCEAAPAVDMDTPKTPSQIPRRKPSKTTLQDAPSPIRSPKKSPRFKFLTRDSNTKAIAWDTRGRLEDMESLYSELRNKLNDTTHESSGLKDTVAIYKTRCRSKTESTVSKSADIVTQ